MKVKRHLVVFALFLLLLMGCARERGAWAPSGGAKGQVGGSYKVGNPYQIKGDWFYPREDYSYDETGIASWYGDDFHGKKTANGEVFNKNELTAAHKTLPMPSLARVTNLDSGRSIVVRVNDRGPFSGSRIIDMSQRASQLLGFEQQGTAKVRVQVLADESKAIADAMRHYGSPTPGGVQTVSSAPTPLVTSEPLPSPVEAHNMMASIQPVQEVRHVTVTGANQIYVQAGSFTKIENAMQMQQKLTSMGNKATIVKTSVNGTLYHRVRLGPIADVPRADALLKKVTASKITNAKIIVD